MRLFSQADLARKLRACGFSDVTYLTEPVEPSGIFLGGRWSLPLVARKERRTPLSSALGPADAEEPEPVIVPPPPPPSIQELEEKIAELNREKWELHDRATIAGEQVRLAAGSRWLRLGNLLGLGPRLR